MLILFKFPNKKKNKKKKARTDSSCDVFTVRLDLRRTERAGGAAETLTDISDSLHVRACDRGVRRPR